MSIPFSVAYNTDRSDSTKRVRSAALIIWDTPPSIVATVIKPDSGDALAYIQDIKAEDSATLQKFLESSGTNTVLSFVGESKIKLHQLLPELPVQIWVKNGKNIIRTTEWDTALKLTSDLASNDVTIKYQV